MFFERLTRICVGSGSEDPRLANMFSKTGTTKVTITRTPTIAMISTMIGYVTAARILFCSSASRW